MMIQYLSLGLIFLVACAQMNPTVNAQQISSTEAKYLGDMANASDKSSDSEQNTEQSVEQMARLNLLNYLLKQEFLKKLKADNVYADQVSNDDTDSSIEQLGEFLRTLKLKRVSLRDVAAKRSNKRGTKSNRHLHLDSFEFIF